MPVGCRAWSITLVVGLLIVLPFKFIFGFPLWLAFVLAVPVGVVAMFLVMFVIVNSKRKV